MHHGLQPRLRIAALMALGWSLACIRAVAQTPAPQTASATSPQSAPSAANPSPSLPNAPGAGLRSRTPEEKESARISSLTQINGRPYQRPTHRDQFHDYLRDSYGWPAFARTTARTLYSEARGHPTGWGQDLPGFMQRFGSNVAVTAINGNVRFAMETVFREDMRYIPCHGCSKKRKIVNALLAEITARHDSDGRRFFTLTPTISDFSGPIIANAFWYPNHDPFDGVIGTRTVVATRVGQHLFTEFVWERRHHDKKIEDNQSLRVPAKP
jgi:hypothetical protein